jgi:hypothetical protein
VGLETTEFEFMNKICWHVIACFSLTALVLVGAPTPGSADLNSPGTWAQVQAAYGDSEFDADLSGDGLTYRLQDTHVFLTNSPGRFWYSPSDTNIAFEYLITSSAVSVRNGDSGTNNGYMEVEVAIRAGPFIYLASYTGFPNVTNVPADPDTGTSAYTITSAPFSGARLCIAPAAENPVGPLGIRGGLGGGPQVELSWTSSTNGLFQVQWCFGFAENSWTDLGLPLAGDGMILRVVDSVEPTTAQRFYRVLAFP